VILQYSISAQKFGSGSVFSKSNWPETLAALGLLRQIDRLLMNSNFRKKFCA